MNRADKPGNNNLIDIYTKNVKIFGTDIDPSIDEKMLSCGFERITPFPIQVRLTGKWERQVISQEDTLRIELIAEKEFHRLPDTRIAYMYSLK